MYGNNNNPWDQPPQYYEPPQTSRITAAYRADALADGVIAPILKALFLGFTLGVLAGLLVWQLHWPRGLHPLMAFALTWFTVMPLTFWTFTRRGQWLIERISGADLNGDGYIGQPMIQQPLLPQADPELKVIVQSLDGDHEKDLYLPAADRIALLAPGLASGSFDFTVDQAQSVGISRPTYATIRKQLLDRGLAYKIHPTAQNSAIKLTAVGRHVFKEWAEKGTVKAWGDDDK